MLSHFTRPCGLYAVIGDVMGLGSTTTTRKTTNTYVPSFQLPRDQIAAAKALVPRQYDGSSRIQVSCHTIYHTIPYHTNTMTHVCGVVFDVEAYGFEFYDR